MGTPEIAVPAFTALQQRHEVVCAVCQTDKPVGRKHTLTAPAIKQCCAAMQNTRVFQPQTLRDPAAVESLAACQADVFVVMAYGKLLPPQVLALPRLGCVNIHASLLPRYRGAAPIQRVLLDGCGESGVTTMLMDEGLDTGDILMQRRFSIDENDGCAAVFAKVGEIGAQLILETLDALEAGTAVPTPQDGAAASWAPSIKKDEGDFDFTQSAAKIHDRVRAFETWPVACFASGGRRVKTYRTLKTPQNGRAGEILALHPLTVACGEGALQLLEVQPENSRRMTGTQWAAGARLQKGDIL